MNERQKRLIEVYEYLRRYFGIHTKTGFAEALHYGRTSLSAAMNGDESYLTDNLFKNICDAYPGTFNLDYLLNGEGDLLTIEEDVHNEELKKQSSSIDQGSLINAALAAKDETIAAKQEIIDQLNHRLEEKDVLITELRARIADLQRLALLTHPADPLRSYPFKIGVAESDERPRL
jgi:hypothetical protein